MNGSEQLRLCLKVLKMTQHAIKDGDRKSLALHLRHLAADFQAAKSSVEGTLLKLNSVADVSRPFTHRGTNYPTAHHAALKIVHSFLYVCRLMQEPSPDLPCTDPTVDFDASAVANAILDADDSSDFLVFHADIDYAIEIELARLNEDGDEDGGKPKPPPGGKSGSSSGDVVHSIDFRSARWSGTPYSFTASQATVVRVLHENWDAGTPDVGDETLLDAVDPEAPPARLSTLFRDHPAWGTMIVPGGTKGTRRLDDPPDPATKNS